MECRSVGCFVCMFFHLLTVCVPHLNTFPQSHHDTLIWHIEQDSISLQSTIKSHQKSVTDLSWSRFLPYLVATSSRDKYAYIWDIRCHNDTSKANKVRTYCGWTKGIQKIQFNKKNHHQIAFVQDNEVCIYDIRREGQYLSKFDCFSDDIVSFDWSYHSEDQFLTSSKNAIKMWDITSLNSPTCMFEMKDKPFDFDRALCAPFHSDFFITSQNNDSIYLWSISHPNSEPYKTFTHHTNIKPSFDWRIMDIDQRKEYQLLTLTYDHHLKLSPIQDNLKMPLHESKSDQLIPKQEKSPEKEMQSKVLSTVDTDELNQATIAPRLCGAQFFGSGHMLIFGTSKSLKKAKGMQAYPKTCKEYFECFDGEKKKTKAKNTISQYFYSPNMTSLPNGEYLGPVFHHSLMSVHDESKKWQKQKSFKNRIQIFDVSILNPVNYNLAALYKINGGSISSICKENAVAASKVRRKDLIKLWTLLSHQVESMTHQSTHDKVPQDEIPWHLHPFGVRLLKSLVLHYEKQHDVQTLAMIACVLANPLKEGMIGSHRNSGILLLSELEMFDRYKVLYGEILYRWGFYTKRCQVMKTMKEKRKEEEETLSM